MPQTRLGIIGAGELGKQVAEIAMSAGSWSSIAFFDDQRKEGEQVEGHPVVGKTQDIIETLDKGDLDGVILGIGFHHFNVRKHWSKIGQEWPWATLIGQGCIVAPSAQIGKGSILYPGTIIDRNVTVDSHNLLNLGCVIAHDCFLGPNNFLAPSVTLSGFVRMGSRNFVGSGSVISSRITLGDDNLIGAGSVVVRDVPSGVKAYGNPAKEK